MYVADRFGGWQAKVLTCLAGMYDAASSSVPADTMQQVGAASGAARGGDAVLASIERHAGQQA